MEVYGRLAQAVRPAREYAAAFFRWLLLGAVVGAAGGAVGALFSKAVEYATNLRGENGWLLYLLPLGGLLIVGLYKLCRVSGVGTNEVFESVRAEKGVSILLAPAIFLGTVITHLFGGSAGREGAALQLGGSVATFFGRLFRLSEQDRHILTMCGMSAVFAAVFGTPMAACVFAVEVVSVGRFCSAALFPCIVSASTAFAAAQLFGVEGERFPVALVPAFSAESIWKMFVIAVAGALVSVLFCWAMHTGAHLFQRFIPNEWLRVAAGGVLVVALSLLVGTTDYNGGGISVIERVFASGDVRPEAFLLKILFTAVTIGAGFKGGEIVPTLFIGATMGGALSLLIGLDPAFGAAVGIAALFCGVTNCPLATVLLSIELFGGEGALFYMLAACISFLLSGCFSLYTGQHIVFSKLREEEIDARGH